ncbi:MAG: hypothetical protein ABSA79_02600 [Candidatus Bathyarchaeia archaeon]|jgi:hypothetical protein
MGMPLVTSPPKGQTLSFKNLVLTYSNESLMDFRYQGVSLEEAIFKPLKASQFGLYFTLDPSIGVVCQEIFDLAGHIQKTLGKYTLSAGIANAAFGWFKNATRPLSSVGAQVASTIVWQKVCEEAWKWETRNNPIKLHKGTPYYFLAGEYLTAGNLDAGYLFVHNAVEEDKRLALQTGTPQSYKDCPAYMLASLVVSKNNYLHDLVDEMKKTIDAYISSFVTAFGAFSFSDLENKFLRNDALEEIKYVFIYNMSSLIQQKKLVVSGDLMNNDFSRLRNLDTIVNFSIIIDKVLQARFGEDYMNRNIEAYSATKGLTKAQLERFKNEKAFGDDPDVIIPKLLPATVTFNDGTPVRPEIVCMLIAHKLRNYGSHNLSSQLIFATQYNQVIEKLMHSLFLAVKELP